MTVEAPSFGMAWPVYEGTKRLRASPMNKRAYCNLRGWDVPGDEDPHEAGYVVEYLDGGKPNLEGYAGYVSWSPADVFGRAYRLVDVALFDFGEAIRRLKAGDRVARAGWNGKGMFLFLVAGSTFKVNRPPLLGIYAEGTEIRYHAHVDMKTAQGDVVPWLASQTDVLAEDWQVADI